MSRKAGIPTDHRVVVYPRSLGDFGGIRMSDKLVCSDDAETAKRYEERCREIASDIKRHVDNAGAVYIERDTPFECSYCGSQWTESGTEYNGGCCEQDEQNNPAALKEVKP